MKRFYILIVCFGVFSNSAFAQGSKAKAEEFFQLATKYFDKENFQSAIQYYDSAIVTNAEHVESYAYRGMCKLELKQFTQAIEDFNLCLILAPGYAEVYFFRGIAQFELKNNKDACEDWFDAYLLGYHKAIKLIKQKCESQMTNLPK